MHEWIDHYDALFFDFDGLLVDSEPLHYNAYKIALAEMGFSLNWDFPRYQRSSLQSKHMLSEDIYALFPKLRSMHPDWEEVRQKKNDIYQQLLETAPPQFMPGAKELLLHLAAAKKPRAIVTNSKRSQLDIVAKALPELTSIPHWITREDYNSPKPSSDPYLKAISQLGVEKGRLIAFEDAVKGIKALEGTTITPILICPENHPQFDLVDSIPCERFDSFLSLQSRGAPA